MYNHQFKNSLFLLKVMVSQFAISQFTILNLKLWLNEQTSKQGRQEHLKLNTINQ